MKYWIFIKTSPIPYVSLQYFVVCRALKEKYLVWLFGNIYCMVFSRERANKRKLQETVREFSLICRGLVGTDYAAHSSLSF